MNIKSIAGKIGMDYEEALEYYGGDVTLLKNRLETLVDDVDFPGLRKAVEDKDEESTRIRAHKIRKLSEKVCLKELGRLADNLENAKGLKEMHAFLALEKEWLGIEKALVEDKAKSVE